MDVEAINTNLLRAVEKGNWFTVREAIHEVQASNGIHDWSFLSKNLVERACDRGDEEIMGLLVRMCSQEDFTDLSKRTTILHRAVRRRGGRYGIVRLLLDSALSERSESVKEYVNIQDHEGKTALHHVAVSGDSYMLDILCKAGADVNIRDERNLLPAHIACIAGEYEMMRRLFGKDRMSITQVMHHEEVAGSAPIHLVAERNCWKELVYLMDLFQKENIQAKDINYELAWYKACRGTSRLYSTPAYSGMAQGFPNSLEAAIVLIYNEYRRPLTYDQPDWKEYSFPGITCYSFQINHFRGIYALFGKLLIEGRIKTQDMNRFIAGFQYEQHIRDPNDQGPVVLKLREPSCTVTHGGGFKSFTIAMPYFKVLTEDSIAKWRDPKLVNASLRPFTPLQSNCPSWSLESLKAPYLPLTLDEYCCSTLPKSMLDRRNRDQVLYKAKNTNSNSKELVTICQLWILQCEDGLITAHETDEELNTNGSKSDFPSWGDDCLTGDAKRYIGIMMSHFVDSLDRPSETGSGNRILNTFENSIASCAHDVDEYSRGEVVKKFDIDKEREFLHNIDDIRGELGMIKRAILQQEEVWKTFASNAWPEHWTTGAEGRLIVKDDEQRSTAEENEWQIILRAQFQFDRFRRRIAQLDEDAARVEKSIMAKLDLKQKHASLQESHATGVMSAAVLGFTLITIIFTPLSFLTSLFALSIDSFQRNQIDFFIPNRENEADLTNRTRVYTANYIGKWAATTVLASTAVALLSMWLVIEYGMDVPVLRHRLAQLVKLSRRMLGLPKLIWESQYLKKVSEQVKLKVFREKGGCLPSFGGAQRTIWYTRLKLWWRRRSP